MLQHDFAEAGGKGTDTSGLVSHSILLQRIARHESSTCAIQTRNTNIGYPYDYYLTSCISNCMIIG